MVISTVNQVVYNGDGITTAWPFTFRIIDATDIKLLLIDADGTETDVSADYYVDMVNNTVYYPGYAPGAEPPEDDQPPKVQTGQKLVVYRELPITQEADLGDKWPFKVIENGLDKLTMILQQIFDWWGRTLKISQGGSVDGFDTNVYPEAGKVIAVNEDGDGFECREALMEVNGAWDGEGRQIHSVADPTGDQDAATKNYVDTLTDNNFMKLQPDGEAWEGRGLPVSNVATPGKVKDAATKEYVDNLIDNLSVEADRYVVFNNVAAMVAADLPAGYNTRTLGYHDINDGGAGTYSIRGKVTDETEDGGSVIFLDNGNVAELIVNDDTIYFKQWGAKEDGVTDDTSAVTNAVAYATSKGISYVKCGGTVKASASINIAFNFEFNNITYTGTGHAIVIDSQIYRRIVGRQITSNTGAGVLLTTTTNYCMNNYIDIEHINISTSVDSTTTNNNGSIIPTNNVNGVDIIPIDGGSNSGILQNYYRIGNVHSTNGYGINTYIAYPGVDTSNTLYEGEDIFDVTIAYGGMAGVNFEIESDGTDKRNKATITGITYLHLSVESCMRGVRMKCGTARNTTSLDYTIKSVHINNMRCREFDVRGLMFLDATGWLRDIVIRPTSPIYMPQWRLINTSLQDACRIIAPIRNYISSPKHRYSIIGENVCSVRGKVMVEKPIQRRTIVPENSTFDMGDMLKKYNDEAETLSECANQYRYCSNNFQLANNATLILSMYQLIDEVLLVLRANATAAVNIPQYSGSPLSVTITNNTEIRKYYKLMILQPEMTSDNLVSGQFINALVVKVIEAGNFVAEDG